MVYTKPSFCFAHCERITSKTFCPRNDDDCSQIPTEEVRASENKIGKIALPINFQLFNLYESRCKFSTTLFTPMFCLVYFHIEEKVEHFVSINSSNRGVAVFNCAGFCR